MQKKLLNLTLTPKIANLDPQKPKKYSGLEAAVYRGPKVPCPPPFFTEVYTALEIHYVNSSVIVVFCFLGYDFYLLNLIHTVYPIIL